MSVYTSVDADQITALLGQYPLGSLKDFRGIEAGIENTNYFISTNKADYVLTIFEHASIDDLQFDLQLMEHLAKADIPCPQPLHRIDGELLSIIANKPAALVSRLSGKSPETISPRQCAEVGYWLAHLHIAGQGFSLTRKTTRDLNWAATILTALQTHIRTDQYDLLMAELSYQRTVTRAHLPQGIIHSDLFNDNVLFDGEKLTGLLDLYDTCTDTLLYDIAITANAWCSQPSGAFNHEKLSALIRAYSNIRPLTDAERSSWPSLTRAAALRFWLSRLHRREFQPTAELTQIKLPEVYENILQQRQNEPPLSTAICG